MRPSSVHPQHNNSALHGDMGSLQHWLHSLTPPWHRPESFQQPEHLVTPLSPADEPERLAKGIRLSIKADEAHVASMTRVREALRGCTFSSFSSYVDSCSQDKSCAMIFQDVLQPLEKMISNHYEVTEPLDRDWRKFQDQVEITQTSTIHVLNQASAASGIAILHHFEALNGIDEKKLSCLGQAATLLRQSDSLIKNLSQQASQILQRLNVIEEQLVMIEDKVKELSEKRRLCLDETVEKWRVYVLGRNKNLEYDLTDNGRFPARVSQENINGTEVVKNEGWEANTTGEFKDHFDRLVRVAKLRATIKELGYILSWVSGVTGATNPDTMKEMVSMGLYHLCGGAAVRQVPDIKTQSEPLEDLIKRVGFNVRDSVLAILAPGKKHEAMAEGSPIDYRMLADSAVNDCPLENMSMYKMREGLTSLVDEIRSREGEGSPSQVLIEVMTKLRGVQINDPETEMSSCLTTVEEMEETDDFSIMEWMRKDNERERYVMLLSPFRGEHSKELMYRSSYRKTFVDILRTSVPVEGRCISLVGLIVLSKLSLWALESIAKRSTGELTAADTHDLMFLKELSRLAPKIRSTGASEIPFVQTEDGAAKSWHWPKTAEHIERALSRIDALQGDKEWRLDSLIRFHPVWQGDNILATREKAVLAVDQNTEVIRIVESIERNIGIVTEERGMETPSRILDLPPDTFFV